MANQLMAWELNKKQLQMVQFAHEAHLALQPYKIFSKACSNTLSKHKASKVQFGLELWELGTVSCQYGLVPHTLVNLLNGIGAHKMTPGIFRVSGVHERRDQIKAALNKGTVILELNEYRGCDIVSCLKLWFDQMKSPVFPHSVERSLVKLMRREVDVENEKRLIMLRAILCELPCLNQSTLRYLFMFIKHELMANSETNKMDSKNIATCLAPTLFKSMVLSDVRTHIEITVLLIEHAEIIGGVTRASLNNVKVWRQLNAGHDVGGPPSTAPVLKKRRFSFNRAADEEGSNDTKSRRSSSVSRNDGGMDVGVDEKLKKDLGLVNIIKDAFKGESPLTRPVGTRKISIGGASQL